MKYIGIRLNWSLVIVGYNSCALYLGVFCFVFVVVVYLAAELSPLQIASLMC